MTGKVWLVGAGPGAPDLLTLRAARLLERADIVFHDALVHPDVVGLAVRAEHIAVGKRCGRHATVQRFINKRLVDAAHRHATVVRLKGGDPLLFGRAEEELASLRAAGIACEIVPGVSAAFGAAADLGLSLTRRGVSRSVAFVTPRVGDGQQASDWSDAAASADTAVVYMGGQQAIAVRDELIARGRSAATPVAVITDASLPQSTRRFGRLRDLPALASGAGTGPLLMIIGAVLDDALHAVESASSLPLQRLA